METSQPPIVADGLNKLHDDGDAAKVDIVFVHGLRGHPRNTWEAVDPSEVSDKIYWPQELLPSTLEKVAKCRVFAFGYPTEFATFFPVVTPEPIAHTAIDDHATSLMTKLGTLRQETHTEDRPIFFISHSLGGLVCANGLARQHDLDPLAKAVVDNTRGTIFLGTPFKGSPKAAWAKIAENILGLFSDSNNETIKDLDKDSTKLKQISIDFHMLLRSRYESRDSKAIQVACFFETKTTRVKILKGIKKDIGQIVSKESATLAGYNPLPINADHRTICKFPDAQTTGYVDVTNMLKTMISNLDKDIDDLEKDGRTIIKLGDVKQGDDVINYGIIAGHVVGTTRDAIRQEVSHVFQTFGGSSDAAAATAAAAIAEQRAKKAIKAKE